MPRKTEGRPDPQALLARVEHDAAPTRGRLKLFLGYAAGVGKTYAMLQAAHAERAGGRDVLVGVLETHQRAATAALLVGLPTLPQRKMAHRDIVLEEFDLDACLARHPQLVLVDELAHTNAPGSRHRKRYQDVEELLEAGIDVYSTLNIQHLESLNDVVEQITGVRVRETLPDKVLETASSLALIDLPPEELLLRLKRGQVYQPAKAEAAARNFFRPGNLTALRELALRQTADRVDDDVLSYMKRRSISGPWPVTDRLVVAVGPSPFSERLVRAARRLAEALSAEWFAVSVRTGQTLSVAAEDRIVRHLQLAESLGARTEVVTGLSISEALVTFAEKNNITKIVAGKPLVNRWWSSDLVDQLIRRSGDIDIFVVSGKPGETAPTPPAPARPLPWSRYLQAASVVVLATLLCFPISHLLTPTNLVMVYLLVVTLIAYWWGRGPSALASALSVAVLDFYFVPPFYTFVVSDHEYVLTFLGLLAVSLSISGLTARSHEQAAAARQREEETAALFALSRALGQALDEQEIGKIVADHATRQLKQPVQFLPPDSGEWELPDAQRAVALWALQHGQLAGKGSETLAEAEVLCLPVLSIEKREVLGGLLLPLERPLSPVRLRLLETFGRQAALALERSRLSIAARESDLLKATERLQTALLNSISHDLRIPLVSISGTLQALRDEPDQHLNPEQRQALLDNALSESDRLNRVVGNLLHMTRLESGVVQANLQPQELGEIVEMTMTMLRRPARVRVELPPDLPLVEVDFGLLQQVLANLLENALKYSEGPVEVGVWPGERAELWVRDYGRGVPEAEREQIFERFYRVRADISGSGLGLSICKGLVEAQGGTIRVEPADPGARFVVALNWDQPHE
ncbi:MAG: sensor histidine kinase KdpD [Candidatus Eremiobacteraeota bacterium]|nr:sensor histidine kinase KdpD [Candidatus Eremiobacteraeota bacterium]MCW5872683.1 sensor histidine kinase KdpD [Candidatus Eremiobacteraeota bacterium]